jgi:hypothetical protein
VTGATNGSRYRRLRSVADDLTPPPLWSPLTVNRPAEPRPISVGVPGVWSIWSRREAEDTRNIHSSLTAHIYAAVNLTVGQLDGSTDGQMRLKVIAAWAGREAHEAIESIYHVGSEGVPVIDPHGAPDFRELADQVRWYLLIGAQDPSVPPV